MSSRALPNPATRVFHFKRCLGSGSFGEVYEATMTSPGGLEKRVAVKLLKAEVAGDEDAVRRLRDEGLLLANLDHPSILAVIDLIQLGDRKALVTEFVDGEDLLELLRGKGDRIPLRPFILVIAQVARALDVAWSTRLPGRDEPLHLLHRDIKPANIRVGRHGLVKLLDFGIARSDQVDREARTETDVLVGSVPYMAPEVFSHGVTDRVDVFALGCVLYEGLFGSKLYRGQKRPQVLRLLFSEAEFKAFVDSRLADGQQVRPDADPVAVRSIADCLSWNPEDRPSAAQLASRLERLASILDGPSLAEWCRDRAWPEPRKHEGSLVGSTVTEGSVFFDAEGLESDEPPAPRRALFAVGATIALVVGCLGVGTAGLLVAQPWATPASPRPVDVEPTPDPAPEPAPDALPEPEPEPDPEPVEPEPAADPVEPEPAPTPDPEPVSAPKPDAAAPKPTPAPVPEPAEAPEQKGPVSVWFQNQDGERFGPEQELLPGPYRIIADFGDGAERVGSADVAPGQEIRLVCNPATRSCSLK
jgi:serine/threonine-protein kinase